jgi:hypothetical protein
MGKVIKFKKRETTAKQGRVPNCYLIFTMLKIEKEEIALLYNAICSRICKLSTTDKSVELDIYASMMIDIENMINEARENFTDNEEFFYEMPIHILELDLLIDTINDEVNKLRKLDNSNEDCEKLFSILSRIALLRQKYDKLLIKYFDKFNSLTKISLLKDIWDKTYELTDYN